MRALRAALKLALGFLIIFALIALVVWGAYSLLQYFTAAAKGLGAPLVTGAATIIVATITVMVGRYYERKKELDSLYREKKIEIYDEFLAKFFGLMFNERTYSPEELTQFLREFTRKLLLWSGPEVIESFVIWRGHLAKGVPDAKTIFLTEDFLLAIRKDLRHSRRSLRKGFYARLFLKEGDLFLAMAEKDPSVTLEQLAIAEKLLAATMERSAEDDMESEKRAGVEAES